MERVCVCVGIYGMYGVCVSVSVHVCVFGVRRGTQASEMPRRPLQAAVPLAEPLQQLPLRSSHPKKFWSFGGSTGEHGRARTCTRGNGTCAYAFLTGVSPPLWHYGGGRAVHGRGPGPEARCSALIQVFQEASGQSSDV